MKKRNVIIIHFIFWILFVIMPVLLFRLDDMRTAHEWYRFLHMTAVNLVAFYLAYWILIPKLLLKKSPMGILWISLVWVIGVTAVRVPYSYLIKEMLYISEEHPFTLERQIVKDLFGSLMFTAYPIFIYFSIEWFRERQYRFELVREKQKSEIDLLKFQMNPHFLMNTLNNLYSLVYQGSSQASNAVMKLSEIMRYMLYETDAELVPLENEVKYLQSFIELEMLRFRNQELVEFEIKGDLSGKMIAPMILMPFVENAFKHGNKYLPGMGITIRLSATREEIIFEVMNFKAAKDVHKDSGSGIGLLNIRKRLELQYPDSHDLEITDGVDFYQVYLLIRTR